MSLTNDFELTLNGETYTLRYTLKAASAISTQYGGFAGAFEALRMLNLQVVTFIIRTGTGGKGADGRAMSTDDMNDVVWRHGIGKLTGDLAKYLLRLQNGGRDPADDEDDDAKDRDQGNG